MLRIIFSLLLMITIGCASFGGFSKGKLNSIAERCKKEQLSQKPEEGDFQNMNTRDRNKNRKEFKEFRKNRIELYQDIYKFNDLYLISVNKDGRCLNNCVQMHRLLQRISELCPETAKLFPVIQE